MGASAALLALVLAVALGALLYARRRRPASPTSSELERMDGPAFERYVCALFERHGFAVRDLGGRGDFGAGLIVSRDGRTTAVQVKARKDYAGISAVQQVLGARFFYGCDAALAVTNRFFSNPARELAAKADVVLWTGEDVVAAATAAAAAAQTARAA